MMKFIDKSANLVDLLVERPRPLKLVWTSARRLRRLGAKSVAGMQAHRMSIMRVDEVADVVGRLIAEESVRVG